MQEFLEAIYAANAEYGQDQTRHAGEVPPAILMIDKETLRPVSPQLAQFYGFATVWSNGLFAMDLADPNDLRARYEDEWTAQVIELTAENYKPLPPSDPGDASRTALLAYEPGGMGLALLWWRDGVVEPAVVTIEGGSIRVFEDIQEMLDYAANGVFPEQGDAIYTQLEEERGTLGG